MNESVNREIDSGGRFGGALGEEFARVSGMIRRGSIQRSPNIRVSHTSAGVLLEPAGAFTTGDSGGGGGGGGSEVLHFSIASVSANLLTATDGTFIAKPPALRGDLPPFTIYGSLDDWSVRPSYSVGDSVYVTQLETTDPTTGADFLDLNVDARSWHFKLSVCDDGQMRDLWISSGGLATTLP